jgi:F420-0:gamma-glutamyl ligase
MKFQKSNIANGLAAAAVTLMGEGSEQTPLAVLEDISFVEFQRRNPTEQEVINLKIEREDDLYWPLLQLAPWKKGKGL